MDGRARSPDQSRDGYRDDDREGSAPAQGVRVFTLWSTTRFTGTKILMVVFPWFNAGALQDCACADAHELVDHRSFHDCRSVAACQDVMCPVELRSLRSRSARSAVDGWQVYRRSRGQAHVAHPPRLAPHRRSKSLPHRRAQQGRRVVRRARVPNELHSGLPAHGHNRYRH